MMIQEFIRLFTLQELKKIKKCGRFSLDNSKSQTPTDQNEFAGNMKRKETGSPLKKHNTLQNLDHGFIMEKMDKHFI